MPPAPIGAWVHMRHVALVTDSTAGLSAETATLLGVAIVPASFAFAEQRFLDGDSSDVFARMDSTGIAPRTFGVAESAFREAFELSLRDAEAVLCVVTPFDVNPSFTTACAAMLAIQFDSPEAAIKVLNAGVGGAGLGALIVTLAELAKGGASLDGLLAAIDDLEPRCESLYVPGDPAWLERAGRLASIEERIGALDGRSPVLRLGTRITSVVAEETHEAAIEAAIERAGARSGGAGVNVSVVQGGASACAARVAEEVQRRWPVARLETSEMSPTHGSQLGPGSVGIGLCPVAGRGG